MSEEAVVPCSYCGGLNRVLRARFADVPLCHKCRRHLFGVKPAELGEADFGRFLSHSSLPVLVDFWAEWCGPCKMMAPQFEAAAKALAGVVLFAKVDTEQAQELAGRFKISGIPTVILLAGSTELGRLSGYQEASDLVSWVRSTLPADEVTS